MDLIAAIIGLVFASATATLFARNLTLYRPAPQAKRTDEASSVLIPARNEERNIGPAVRSILESTAAPIEVIVLDDASTDKTAEIVREIARSDRRVRIETAPPLPPGWCGKQHACHVLSGLASHPILIFLDADVRLKPGAVARMTAFLEQSGAALASGVPEQVTRTASERLLVPLIHFVLLGFLPIRRMRIDLHPALGAGCGQLFVAFRHAYVASGGHRAIRRRCTMARSCRASFDQPAFGPTSLTRRTLPAVACFRREQRCGVDLPEMPAKGSARRV